MNEPEKVAGADPVPAFVQERCDYWGMLVGLYAKIYYGLGIGSAVASATSAAIGSHFPLAAQCLAAIAAVLTTAFGFIQPRQNYYKFRKGWRVLDSEIMRFKEGMGTREDLINTVIKMEAFFDQYEDANEKLGKTLSLDMNNSRGPRAEESGHAEGRSIDPTRQRTSD